MENPTFYDTIIRSKQWQKWEKEQERRKEDDNWKGVFDYDESRECGLLSSEHFESFMDFCGKMKKI